MIQHLTPEEMRALRLSQPKISSEQALRQVQASLAADAEVQRQYEKEMSSLKPKKKER